jgi:secreted PhoX family phosphatase
VVARPALGAKAHEGTRFDSQGNLYGISERNPGYIFKFVPDHPGSLATGQLYALEIVSATGDRTGDAEWLPLDRASVRVDANAVAQAAGATGYNRPEDVEIATSSGNSRGGADRLFVAITGQSGPADNRVLAIDLRVPDGGATHSKATVFDYVRIGLNAPADFEMPDNLALDRAGNLYIAEDPGGSFATKHKGDDIWVATPPSFGVNGPAASVVRFATLTDCDAEPTGIYFGLHGDTLFVNAQHRGGDHADKAIAIARDR